MGAPRFEGISDAVTTCECCGRTDLRRTIALSMDGESDPVYFGRDCAARALRWAGYRMTGKEAETQAAATERAQRELQWVAAALVRVEDMLAAGHQRYVIGGKEIGADLQRLQQGYARDVDRLRREVSRVSRV